MELEFAPVPLYLSAKTYEHRYLMLQTIATNMTVVWLLLLEVLR